MLTDADIREMVAKVAEARGWPTTARNLREDNIFCGTVEIGNVYAAIRAAFALGGDPDRMKRVGKSLGGVSTPRMDGDNLAIILCSHFDNADQAEGENGWTPDAEAGCEEVLAAIRDHYEQSL
jgi:hypothetical protein